MERPKIYVDTKREVISLDWGFLACQLRAVENEWSATFDDNNGGLRQTLALSPNFWEKPDKLKDVVGVLFPKETKEKKSEMIQLFSQSFSEMVKGHCNFEEFKHACKKMQTEANEINDFRTKMLKAIDDGSGAIKDVLAERILRENNIFTMYDTREVYHYEEGVYVPGTENQILAQSQQYMDSLGLADKLSGHIVNEVIGQVQRKTFIKREEFDQDTNLMCVQNGVYDFATGNFFEHDPKVKFTVKIQVQYVADEDCPTFKKFLGEVVDKDNIPLIFEIIGYCLYKKYTHHKAFMFTGEGANGKSTLIEVMRSLLGPENCVNISIQELEKSRFAKAYLFGKLANLCADLSASALKTTGTFKTITGGDAVTVDKKFKDAFTFVNFAKLIYSANQIPIVEDDSDAFFRRWIIINFPNKFEGDNADKKLIEKLTTTEELSGIFNEAIFGLKRIIETGKFSSEKTTKETKELYIRMSDSVAAFVMDIIELSSGGEIKKADLLVKYNEYCRERAYPAVSDTTFYKRMGQQIRVEEVFHGRERWWKGIKFVGELEKIEKGSLIETLTP
jgi:putative DNA primase/helicase